MADTTPATTFRTPAVRVPARSLRRRTAEAHGGHLPPERGRPTGGDQDLALPGKPEPRSGEDPGAVAGGVVGGRSAVHSSREASWPGSKCASPTMAPSGSPPATATPRADYAPRAPSPPAERQSAPPTARRPRSARVPGTTTPAARSPSPSTSR